MNEIPVYPQENIEPSITISNIDRIPQVYKNNQYRSQDWEINEEEQSIVRLNQLYFCNYQLSNITLS